jgi:CNT family concentrative nucleoside transporter
VAWLLSSDRRRVPRRVVLWGLAAQAGLAWLVLDTALGASAFDGVSGFFVELIGMTDAGTAVVFGPLARPEVLAPALGAQNASIPAFKGLPCSTLLRTKHNAPLRAALLLEGERRRTEQA